MAQDSRGDYFAITPGISIVTSALKQIGKAPAQVRAAQAKQRDRELSASRYHQTGG
jgi:hypothetical protein